MRFYVIVLSTKQLIVFKVNALLIIMRNLSTGQIQNNVETLDRMRSGTTETDGYWDTRLLRCSPQHVLLFEILRQ